MFITLEGPEGSGKSMQIRELADFIRQRGFEVLTTREPGGTFIGDQIREVIMRMDNTMMHPNTEILLFCAARAQIVTEVIRPNLEKGVVVISDRYGDSTLAYQGYGHGLDRIILKEILKFATGGLTPDLTLLLDVDVDEGLNRKIKGGSEWNRLDAQKVEFHKRVRDGYLEMASAEPQRWHVINAANDPQIVQRDIREVILKKLESVKQ
ncbi:MAG: dTMP kinase [Chloroflexi bacterium HGW-Chloroflexi-4]|jgi:dTMP kinase|nr:MAG: dTMP kinase [Chloroflexi bacterium HGW-Chloroflexi-4]